MKLPTLISQAAYLSRGIIRRITSAPICPCCGSSHVKEVDKKFAHQLVECQGCRILIRFPVETSEEMSAFYQRAYQQKGLTTDLPTPEELKKLVDGRFVGSEKDASSLIDILKALRIPAAAKVLDYGANWGYTTYQLNLAGYQTCAFEISESRAFFGRQLGINIHTDLASVGDGFDVVFSSHVLEHVDNPLASLHRQMDLLGPGGLVIGFTPNGSKARRDLDWKGFHLHWGRVHPALLSLEFIRQSFPALPTYVSSERSTVPLAAWDQTSNADGPMNGSELFFVLKKCA